MKLKKILNEIKASQIKKGDIISVESGQTYFLAEVDYVEDDDVYFMNGDDQYYTNISDIKASGKKPVWIAKDYEG